MKKNAIAGRSFASFAAMEAHLEAWAHPHRAGGLRHEVDGNAYSVPWRLIGECVRVAITGEMLRVSQAGREVAVHPRQPGRRQRLVDPAHFEGVAGFRPPEAPPALMATAPVLASQEVSAPPLLRPLAEYEALIGGGF